MPFGGPEQRHNACCKSERNIRPFAFVYGKGREDEAQEKKDEMLLGIQKQEEAVKQLDPNTSRIE